MYDGSWRDAYTTFSVKKMCCGNGAVFRESFYDEVWFLYSHNNEQCLMNSVIMGAKEATGMSFHSAFLGIRINSIGGGLCCIWLALHTPFSCLLWNRQVLVGKEHTRTMNYLKKPSEHWISIRHKFVFTLASCLVSQRGYNQPQGCKGSAKRKNI